MKSKTILTLAVLLSFSCAPTRQTLRSDVQLEQSRIADVDTREQLRRYAEHYWSAVARELQERDLRIVRVEYDTSKPSDSLTGRPPIAAETTLTDRTRTGSESVAQGGSHVASTHDSTHSNRSTEDVKMHLTEKSTEKQGLSNVWAWLIAAIAIAMLVIVVLWRIK